MLVFKSELTNPMGGAVLGKRTVCRVIIIPGKLSKSKVGATLKVLFEGIEGAEHCLPRHHYPWTWQAVQVYGRCNP